MKYSDTVAKIENILTENGIGLMRITDLSTVKITDSDIHRATEEGIPAAGDYRIVSLQVAIPFSK